MSAGARFHRLTTGETAQFANSPTGLHALHREIGPQMPGYFDRHRFLGLNLGDDVLGGTSGVLCPTGHSLAH
jgi:hypothetical protein